MAAGKEEKDPLAEYVVKPLKSFSIASYRFLSECEKPTTTELWQIVGITGVGFLLMGVIGFVVKLVHFPIKQILLS